MFAICVFDLMFHLLPSKYFLKNFFFFFDMLICCCLKKSNNERYEYNAHHEKGIKFYHADHSVQFTIESTFLYENYTMDRVAFSSNYLLNTKKKKKYFCLFIKN